MDPRSLPRHWAMAKGGAEHPIEVHGCRNGSFQRLFCSFASCTAMLIGVNACDMRSRIMSSTFATMRHAAMSIGAALKPTRAALSCGVSVITLEKRSHHVHT
jgi:hypothetical protein